MWRTRPIMAALVTLVLFPSAALAQADPLVAKPDRPAALKVGDRVVIPFGIEPRASKDAADEPRLRPPAQGDQRNAFRVYRVEKIEPDWVWIQAEHDGTAGWVSRTETTLIEKAFGLATNEILDNPTNPGVFIHRALLWAEKGELDLAIADYDTAIRLDPSSATAHNNRGTLWRRKKDNDRAIADFTEAIKLDPLYAAAYNNRGITWKFKDLDRAIADYSEAINIDPNYFVAYNNRGNSYRQKKDLDLAIADFTKAIQMQPRYGLAYANRGMVYRTKNDFARAVEDYNQAIRIDPKNSVALNNRAWLWSVCPDSKFRDGAKAVETATLACELTTWKLASNIDTLAAACAEAGDFESAMRWQQKAQPLFPNDESRKRGLERLNLYKLGKHYREVKDPDIK